MAMYQRIWRETKKERDEFIKKEKLKKVQKGYYKPKGYYVDIKL
jgi:hypothetical protein